MKEFFLKLLNDLPRIAGLKQLENIYTKYADHAEGQTKANAEVSELINELCVACNQYDYIPETEKQKIILREAGQDTTYTSLNRRLIHSWLSKYSSTYFKEEAHKGEFKPVELTPEQSKIVDKMLTEYLEQIKGATMQGVPQLSQEQIRREGRENLKLVDRGEFKYTPEPEEQRLLRERVSEVSIEYYRNKSYDYTRLKQFHIDGVVITAMSLEDAQEIYLLI